MRLKNQKLFLLLITAFAFFTCFGMEKEVIDSGSDIGIDTSNHVPVQTASKPVAKNYLPQIDKICIQPKIPAIKAISGFAHVYRVNAKNISITAYPIDRNLIYNNNYHGGSIDVIPAVDLDLIESEFNKETADLRIQISQLKTTLGKIVVCNKPFDHVALNNLEKKVPGLNNQAQELARIKKVGSYLLGSTVAASFGAALFTIITKNPNRLFNPLGFNTNHSAPIIASGFATIGISSYLLGRYLGIFGAKK